MSSTSKSILDLSADSTWQDDMCTIVQVKEFPSFVMDEPKAFGGRDSAPNPIEYLLGALLGCSTITTVMIARELKIDIDSISMHAMGTIDIRGLAGEKGVSPHFQKVTQTIEIATCASQYELNQLANKVAKRCPVHNLIKDAGVAMEVIWKSKEVTIRLTT